MNFLAVALGGALGAIARYSVYLVIPAVDTRQFPVATLLVNVLGSFLLGVVYVLMVEKSAISQELRPLVTIGFLSAFTTFSTFALETVMLIQHGEWLKTALYVVFSVVFCIFATLIAVAFTRMI